MKTIGFNPTKEKFVPVDCVVKLSTPLQLALSKASDYVVPEYMKPVASVSAPVETAGCSGCVFQPLLHRYPSCEDTVCCRAENRRDRSNVFFIYCNKAGEPHVQD